MSVHAPRVARALNLIAEITAALTAAGVGDVDKVHVTYDESDIDKTRTQQFGVIVVLPGPQITYPAPGVQRLAWTIVIVCRVSSDPLPAWTRLDELLSALEQYYGDMLEDAKPGMRPRENQAAIPGYTLTLIEETQN